MNTIFDVVNRFSSFCIIATHSPLVIQEILSRNIYVIEREENNALVRKLEKESFGENLTVITEEIFGNRDIAKHHITVLESLVKDNKGFEEIISLVKSEGVPVNLNTRLYIKSLMSNKG